VFFGAFPVGAFGPNAAANRAPLAIPRHVTADGGDL
jgi:hypothetical protein